MSMIIDPDKKFIFIHFNDTYMLSDHDKGNVLFVTESKKEITFEEHDGVYMIVDNKGEVLWEEEAPKFLHSLIVFILGVIFWSLVISGVVFLL
jgi:outer membrane protein assembly factor BamB